MGGGRIKSKVASNPPVSSSPSQLSMLAVLTKVNSAEALVDPAVAGVLVESDTSAPNLENLGVSCEPLILCKKLIY